MLNLEARNGFGSLGPAIYKMGCVVLKFRYLASLGLAVAAGITKQ